MKRGIEVNRIMVPLIVFIFLVCLVPIQATNLMDTTSNELELYKLHEEMILLRKAYPHEYKSLHYQEYFIGEQSNPNTSKPLLISSSPFPSSFGSSGPMNSSWPMSCHDLHHTGQSPYSTISNPGAEIWRFRCEKVDGGPVIAEDGTIYFGEKGSFMYAVYPNGTLRWQYKLPEGWVWSTPAIAEDGTIYIGTFEGSFFALNPDGSLRWRYHIPGLAPTIVSSPAIASDGTIYFGTMIGDSDGYIYALNPDGTLKWRYLTGYFITSDPGVGLDGTIYIGSLDHYLYAMNPDGTLKWRFLTGGIVKSHPSIASDGTIYFTAFDNTMYALNPDGTEKWQFGYGGSGCNAVTIASDGTLYIAGGDLYALYSNGTVRWHCTLGPDEYVDHSTPAISADGTIYVGIFVDHGGEILAVNPDGTERWRKMIANGWVRSSPAIGSDGTVYIGSASDNSTSGYGFLHAFGQGPLRADAEGPYTGPLTTPLQFHCNVFGGIPPYTYVWSFGDGGTSATEKPTHTYIQSGLYNVTLQVTDNEGNTSVNSTTAFISAPPDTPVISGPPQGKIKREYSYTFVTTDPEGDDVYYYIRWGNNATDWRGPYKSGEEAIQTHTWTKRGTYTIECKAKDANGWQSDWGTLSVTMPYEPPQFPFIHWLLERFPNAFPILRYLLGWNN